MVWVILTITLIFLFPMDETAAIGLLKEHSNSDKDFRAVLAHSKTVQEIALEIGQKIPSADLEFLKTASLLHDIGRFRYPPWKESYRHGLEGGRILRAHKLFRHARVAERHLGAGLSKEDIARQGLNLPRRDFMPKTLEEKIITIADKLVDNTRRIPLSLAAERFKKEISTRSAARIIALHQEVMAFTHGCGRHRKAQRGAAKAGQKSQP